VLIDMARHRGKEWLDKGETFDHNDLEAAPKAQASPIEKRDILLIRTGFMKYWYSTSQADFYTVSASPADLLTALVTGSTSGRSPTWSPTPSPTRSPTSLTTGIALPVALAR